MAHRFSGGALVTREDGGGEYVVCCAVHEFTDGREARYHFVFDRGAILERSGAEAAQQFQLIGLVSESLASYRAAGFDQMRGDCTNGVFTAAFEECREMDAAYRSAPHARDVFKEEWNRTAGRPRDEALEKHGPAIEMDIMRDLEKMRGAEREQPGSLAWPEASEPEPKPEYEDQASGIREVSRSDWQMQDDGLTEQFVAVGQGQHGFHYAVFISYQGGDDYRWREGPPWSEQAFPTEVAAREAAHAEMREVEYDNPYEPYEPQWPQAREESTPEPQEPDIDLDR